MRQCKAVIHPKDWYTKNIQFTEKYPFNARVHIHTRTQIVDAGHFWAQFGDMETVEKLQSLMESIGKRVPTPVSYCKPQELVGRFCLAKFSEDKNYYRAKVLDIHPFVQRDTFGQPVSILLAEVHVHCMCKGMSFQVRQNILTCVERFVR